MVSWFGRHIVLALLLVALIVPPGALTPPISAGAGSTLVAMVPTSCDEGGKAGASKERVHRNSMTMSCAFGAGCIAANFVAPEAISLALSDVSEGAIQWGAAGPLSGLLVPPEVGPPIRSI
jgi:hypothetical protein